MRRCLGCLKRRNMKKAIIIGCPGSGKTTFAEKLKKYTGLPLYYLDAIWHKPDKTHIPREEFDERIKEIFSSDEWIIDGNYSRTIEMRMKECDTVFLFDLPTELCIQGATERIGKERYDLPWLETELDPEFEAFIRAFPATTLPKIYGLIDKYKEDKIVVIFKSHEDADEYIRNLSSITFEFLAKTDFTQVSKEIFAILADNMTAIAPTGNAREEDYLCWSDSVSEGLERTERKIVLIKYVDELIGFFQYFTNADTFRMEEIQLKSEYHGKGIFRKLYGFIIPKIDDNIEFVDAFANIRNEKSIVILEHLGLNNIGLNKNGRSYHFKGQFKKLKEWHENEDI